MINALPIYLIAYSGTDTAAHQKIREIFSQLDDCQFIVAPIKNTPKYKADAVIVDCRNGILSTKTPSLQSDFGELPFIALINELDGNRQSVFELGYYDYISWPILEIEVVRRINSIIFSEMAKKSPMQFSNISLVDLACIYMNDNISYRITLEGLSRHLGTNRNTLSKNFKMAFDVGPLTWLRIHRMQTAANKLIKTQDKIINIALSIGYRDSNNFSTSFKKMVGHTPRDYRKIMQNSKNSMHKTKVFPHKLV